MSLFVWRQEFSVNHLVIDKQHKELFRLANELHAAMLRGEARQALGTTLTRLIDYTRSHFRDEEAMMTRARYPKLAEHKAEHESLTIQVLDLKRGFENGSMAVTVETLHFLRAWLERHIMVTDLEAGAFLSHGVARATVNAR